MSRKGSIFFVLILISSMAVPQAAFPSREAAYRHNKDGLEKLRSKDFKGAIVELKRAYQYYPSSKKIRSNLAIAYNNYGFYLMKNDKINDAIEQFEDAYYYEQTNVYTLYNLGQAYYRVQNMSKAKQYLEKAASLESGIEGVGALLERIKNESVVENSFDKDETMHFILASAPDLPVDKTSYVRTYLEEAYGRIGGLLDHYPKKKTVALLYSEAKYDAMLNGQPHWTLAVFDGKMRIPVNKFKYTDEEVVEIVYHEYAHALVYDLAGEKCPLWLNEGIAGKAESLARAKDKGLMKQWFEQAGFIPFRHIPPDFSQSDDKNVVMLGYIESYLLVEFILRKEGYSGLRNVLADFARGGKGIKPLVDVLDCNLEEFEKEWESYVISECGLSELRYY